MWPRGRGYCYGRGWLKMSSFPSNHLVIFKSSVANKCDFKNVTKLCILIEELHYGITIARQVILRLPFILPHCLFMITKTHPMMTHKELYNSAALSPQQFNFLQIRNPDSKVHGANMGPTWVLSDPDGPHGCPMNLAIRGSILSTGNQTITHGLTSTFGYDS